MTVITRGICTACGLLLLTGAVPARAVHSEIRGRTGLPTVKVGGEKVWMESGNIRLDVAGTTVTSNQNFRLHYPARNLEKKAEDITVAVREDFYRSHENGEVTTADAKGFSSFGIWVDGKRIAASMDPWELNH